MISHPALLPTSPSLQRSLLRSCFLCFIFVNPLSIPLAWRGALREMLLCVQDQLHIRINHKKQAGRFPFITSHHNSPVKIRKIPQKPQDMYLGFLQEKWWEFLGCYFFKNVAQLDVSLGEIFCCQWFCKRRSGERSWVVTDLPIGLLEFLRKFLISTLFPEYGKESLSSKSLCLRKSESHLYLSFPLREDPFFSDLYVLQLLFFSGNQKEG